MRPKRAPQSSVFGVILLGLLTCTPQEEPQEAGYGPDGVGPGGATVLPGMEVLLADSIHLVQGLRVGLITNHTGLDPTGEATIDRFVEARGVDLVALYSPEHGIRGTVRGGDQIQSGRDGATGIPIHSLYGETRKPTPEMLQEVEVLLFDIQDVGARYYTYVSTMAMGMEAAGEAGIPFIVLDRPNPIGGVAVQGNILDPEYSTFVGLYPVPMRHGMTPGELARMFVGEFGIQVELRVVPAAGWHGSMTFQETGLPWVPPSPNMPSVESALHYPGTCLFEGTNISVGRGTDEAFQLLGAPWLDGELLADALESYGIPGVRFEATHFTPQAPGDRKFAGEEITGVRLTATGADYDPTLASLALLREIRDMSGERWEWRVGHFDRLAGTDRLRLEIDEGLEVNAMREKWDEDLERFREMAASYLIYPR